MRASAASSMDGTAPFLRGPRRVEMGAPGAPPSPRQGPADASGRMPETPADYDGRLAALRLQCPRAFGQRYGQIPVDQPLFQHVFTHLTEPYAWRDTGRRQRVLEYANALVFFVFGVAGAEDARGFGDGTGGLERYLQHSRCAVSVARRDAANQAALAALRMRYYPSSTAEPTLPGSSLYLFDRRAPLSINLRWVVQCVVLAKNADEGGVQASFMRDLNVGALGPTVPCANYRTQDGAS